MLDYVTSVNGERSLSKGTTCKINGEVMLSFKDLPELHSITSSVHVVSSVQMSKSFPFRTKIEETVAITKTLKSVVSWKGNFILKTRQTVV